VTVMRAADHRRMPWANGGGVTSEIAVSPEDADMHAFDWRVSMADISHSGPFSSLPGVDRVLLLIEGEGMSLTIDGARVEVTSDEPVRFRGESEVEGWLDEGPTRDLNLMTRRGRCRGDMYLVGGPTLSVEPAVDATQLIVVLGGKWAIAGDSLALGDCVIVDAPLVLNGNGRLAVVTITAE